MTKRMKYIMLVDDSPDDNFFHEREIKKANPENIVITKDSGQDALEYLQTEKVMHHPHPDLIFLDINMPGMTGWVKNCKAERSLSCSRRLRILMTKHGQSHWVLFQTTSRNPSRKLSWTILLASILKSMIP
jgi:CheY-like chemotaxis protein